MTTATRRKSRETTWEKAHRILVEGRLRVVSVQGNEIRAACKGDSGAIYGVSHTDGDVPFWNCSCPARVDCSHLRALQLVTAVER